MVAVTGAALSGDGTLDRLGLAAWHVAGLVIGAGILGVLVSAAGDLVEPPVRPMLAALGLVMVGWGAAALLGRPLPVPSSRAQVPLAWRYTMTPTQYAFAYGLGLGLALTTRVLSIILYALIALIAAASEVRIGLILGAAYAIARAVPVFVALARPAGRRLIDGGDRLRARALRLDGAVAAAAGAVLLGLGV